MFFASLVQDNFREKLKRKDRSVKQAGFIVLHQTAMPSVLVETGFITNKKEGLFLNSASGQQKMAQAIATAIVDYKNNLLANESVFVPGVIVTPEEEKKEEEVEVERDQIYKDVIFKVQIAASKRKLSAKSYNFKGLKDVSRTKEGRLYKYYYGATSNYTAIQKELQVAKDKGYPSAYIVSFKKNNIKVPLSEVLN